MKAVVYQKYGSPQVLEYKEVEKPVPKKNEVLIKVEAVSINAADRHLMRGKPFFIRLMYGLFKPKNTILGADVAGTVEAVGNTVTKYQPGDEVFGDLSEDGFGALAEFVCAGEDVFLKKPDGATFEESAAMVMAAITALQGLRNKGQIQPGQKVLINGASGGVGTFAIQIAKSFGAEVTAVCSPGKIEMVTSLGADHVIDYTREDFTQQDRRYDLIIAANGYHPLSHYKKALTPQGSYVMTGGTGAQIFQALFLGPWMSKKGGKTMTNLAAQSNIEDLAYVAELFEAGKVKPVMDKKFPLNAAVDAFKYIDEGHAKGKVVLTTNS